MVPAKLKPINEQLVDPDVNIVADEHPEFNKLKEKIFLESV